MEEDYIETITFAEFKEALGFNEEYVDRPKEEEFEKRDDYMNACKEWRLSCEFSYKFYWLKFAIEDFNEFWAMDERKIRDLCDAFESSGLLTIEKYRKRLADVLREYGGVYAKLEFVRLFVEEQSKKEKMLVQIYKEASTFDHPDIEEVMVDCGCALPDELFSDSETEFVKNIVKNLDKEIKDLALAEDKKTFGEILTKIGLIGRPTASIDVDEKIRRARDGYRSDGITKNNLFWTELAWRKKALESLKMAIQAVGEYNNVDQKLMTEEQFNKLKSIINEKCGFDKYIDWMSEVCYKKSKGCGLPTSEEFLRTVSTLKSKKH